jgi:hypothetical protein
MAAALAFAYQSRALDTAVGSAEEIAKRLKHKAHGAQEPEHMRYM